MLKLLSVLLVLTAVGELAGAIVTVEFVSVPTQVSTREKESVFYLRSKGGL